MAVINTRSGIEGRLKFRFEGEGAERVCIAYGKLDGEELEVRSPKFKDITPKNSPLWKSDPDQQHCYYTARAWGRRHTPEVILGVYDRDEAQQFQGPDNAKDVTPSVMDRLKAQQPQETVSEREGFDVAHVSRETQTLASVIASVESDEAECTSSAQHTDDTAAASESASPTDAAVTPSAADPGGDEDGEGDALEAAHGETVAPSPSDPVRHQLKRECLDKFLQIVTSEELDVSEKRKTLESAKEAWKRELPDDLEFVKACLQTSDKVAKGELPEAKAREYLEGLL